MQTTETSLTNLTDRPVIVMLNSGRSLHLAPRAHSEPLHQVEVNNNAMITKLLQRRLILLQDVEPATAATELSSTKTETADSEGKQSTRPARKDKSS